MVEPMAALRFLGRSTRRVAVTIVGGVIVLVGVVLLFIPGPGIPLIVAGLAVLATEYAWARHALVRARERTRRAARKVKERRKR